jgi:hypothetical protein
MLLRLRLLVTGALLLWFFLLVFGAVGRLLSSPTKAKPIAEAPAVESKAANLPHQKKTAAKNIAEVAAPATARWEP